MTREQYLKLKGELKELAQMVKFKSHNRRAAISQMFGAKRVKHWDEPKWQITYGLERARYEYRHIHILLSLSRGKTRQQIEPKVLEGNKVNETYIKELETQYEPYVKALCAVPA